MKTCKQCGDAQPLTEYRAYYNGGSSRNNTCKTCEKINSRRKYLEGKDGINEHELSELKMIYELYDTQRANGLRPPRKSAKEIGVASIVDDMLHKQLAITQELSQWLYEPLEGYTPEQLDSIYEKLQHRYRPLRGLNRTTMLPIYDETYKELLDKVAIRFDDYEEAYYNNEQG